MKKTCAGASEFLIKNYGAKHSPSPSTLGRPSAGFGGPRATAWFRHFESMFLIPRCQCEGCKPKEVEGAEPWPRQRRVKKMPPGRRPRPRLCDITFQEEYRRKRKKKEREDPREEREKKTSKKKAEEERKNKKK